MHILSFSETLEIDDAILSTVPVKYDVGTLSDKLKNTGALSAIENRDIKKIIELLPAFDGNVYLCTCAYLGWANKEQPNEKYPVAIASLIEELRLSGKGNSEIAKACIDLVDVLYDLARVLVVQNAKRSPSIEQIFTWAKTIVDCSSLETIKHSIEKLVNILYSKKGKAKPINETQ